MNHSKMVPSNWKKKSKPTEEGKTKQELEDRSNIIKFNFLLVSKVDDELIKTRKYEKDRIILKDLVHF